MKTFLCLLTALVLLTSTGVRADTGQILPPYTPPTLAMVVLLDDTRTMTSQNSARASGHTAPNRGTDPDDTRAGAVLQIAALLDADQARTHQLAVYSFRSDSGTWLTGSGSDKFVTLGNSGGSASSANLQALAAALKSRTVEVQKGGGDVNAAIIAAHDAFADRFAGSSTATALAVVLLTDDVPIIDFSNRSPWQSGVADWRSNDAAGFISARARLDSLPTYTGVSCLHAGGTPIFAVLSMGAANWVMDDGSLLDNASQNNIGSFYGDFAMVTTALDGSRMFYPIAPQFEDTPQMRDQFQAAVGRLMAELRCAPRNALTPVSNETGGVQVFPFEMTPLYPNVRLTVQGQPANVRVFDASGDPAASELTGSSPGVRVSINPDGLQVWSFARDAFRGTWSGRWRIQVDSGATLIIEREIAPTGIAWTATDPRETYPERQPLPLRFTLTASGAPVGQSDTFTLAALFIDTSSGATRSYPLTAQGDTYGVTIPAEDITGASYQVQLAITFNQNWGSSILAGIPYLLGDQRERIVIESQASMEIQQPNVDSEWCRGGVQRFVVKLNWSASIRALADPASLYSYAQVFLLYVPPPPLDVRTPVPPTRVALQPNRGDSDTSDDDVFEVTLTCDSQLLRGSQQVEIVGQLADQVEFRATRLGQYAASTATYTPTPTMTFTPTVTATLVPQLSTPAALPPPARVDVLSGMFTPITQPPLSDVAALAAVGVIAGLGAVGLRRYRRSSLPLTFVSIEQKPDPMRPALRGWRALLPFAQRRTFYEVENAPLFTVRRDDEGRFVYTPNSIRPIRRGGSEIVTYPSQVMTSTDLPSDEPAPESVALISGARYRWRVRRFVLFSGILFTVQRVNEALRPESPGEWLKGLLPHSDEWAAAHPEGRTLPLFTLSWSRYEQAIQIEAAQPLIMNDVEIEAGASDVAYTSETVIRIGEQEWIIYDRHARGIR